MLSIFWWCGLIAFCHAHMEMRLPPPRKSKYNPDYQSVGDVDNDMSAPIGDDFPFPCRGTKPGAIYKKYIAGEMMDVKLGGNAPHNGGHCQFALSYDGGEKWIVIHTIVRTCMPSRTGPIEFNYKVLVPPEAPTSDKVVFSWNWINASGEREFYMNCIDIAIEGKSTTTGVRGVELLVANLPNTPLIDEFARPGSDDGHKLLEKRKNITMYVDGRIDFDTAGPSKPPPPPAPVPAPVPPSPPPAAPSHTRPPGCDPTRAPEVILPPFVRRSPPRIGDFILEEPKEEPAPPPVPHRLRRQFLLPNATWHY